MRRRSFGRKRRATWNWANSVTTLKQDTGSGTQFVGSAILPAARVKYLADNWKRDHITFMGMIGFLRVEVINGQESGPTLPIPSAIDLGIIKADEDAGGPADENFSYFPFQEPEAPGNLTNWDTDNNTQDGLDPFLWTTRLFTFTELNPWGPTTATNGNVAYPVGQLLPQTAMVWPVRYVQTNAFDPNIVVRAKRRLAKNDSLMFFMTWPSTGAAIDVRFSIAFRMLLG